MADKTHYDTVVVGAGVAGLAACVSAAGLGLKTALVEKKDRFGGVARDCFHTHMAGLFENSPSSPFKPANRGICEEVCRLFYDRHAKKCLVKKGKVELLAFDGPELWEFFSRRIRQGGVSVYLSSECTAVSASGGRIHAVRLSGPHPEILKAKTFVDTSGNAVLSSLFSKDAVFMPGKPQLSGYCILLEGGYSDDMPVRIPYAARRIADEHGLDRHLSFVTASRNEFAAAWVLKFSLACEAEVADCEFVFEQLQKRVPGLESARVAARSENIGRRAGLLPKGRAVLEHPSDEQDCAARGFWPSEFWDVRKGPVYDYCHAGRYYCIKKDMLMSGFVENLFFGGKSISASDRARASLRAMGTCMATGELAAQCAARHIGKYEQNENTACQTPGRTECGKTAFRSVFTPRTP